MKKIYILLMHTNTIPAKFVQMFTNYEYSHVAISLEKECKTIYSFGRKSLYNILNGGFSVQEKDGAFFKRFNKTKCKIYELEITDEQYNKIEEIIFNMSANTEKYKYDFLGIVPRFFNIPTKFENRFVCSYFVADVLEKTNACQFSKDTSLVVPKDFENVKNLNEIYSGNYFEYKL